MDAGEYESAWTSYNKRFDPDKYVKFAECFHRLIQGTNVEGATSLLTVGIGEFLYINVYGLVALLCELLIFRIGQLLFDNSRKIIPKI